VKWCLFDDGADSDYVAPYVKKDRVPDGRWVDEDGRYEMLRSVLLMGVVG
jgi:hypothetical protein